MATSGQIQKIFAAHLGVAFGTVRRYTADLMRGGMIREGKHGVAALHWTTSESVNLFIALASGAPLMMLAESVNEVRELAGTAIDNLVNEFRRGQVDTKIVVRFYDGGKRVEISKDGIVATFGNLKSKTAFSRTHTVDANLLFRELADALNGGKDYILRT